MAPSYNIDEASSGGGGQPSGLPQAHVCVCVSVIPLP